MPRRSNHPQSQTNTNKQTNTNNNNNNNIENKNQQTQQQLQSQTRSRPTSASNSTNQNSQDINLNINSTVNGTHANGQRSNPNNSSSLRSQANLNGNNHTSNSNTIQNHSSNASSNTGSANHSRTNSQSSNSVNSKLTPSSSIIVKQKESTLALKDSGNKLFQSANYQEALAIFSRAIQQEEDEHRTNSHLTDHRRNSSSDSKQKQNKQQQQQKTIPNDHSNASTSSNKSTTPRSNLEVLYSNRSATHYALKLYEEALSDADRAIELSGQKWSKAYYRKGIALEGLLRYGEADQCYRTGLECDATDVNLLKSSGDLTLLLRELKITASELACQSNPDLDRFNIMISWLRQGGANFPKLYLQYYSENYRGVHSLAKISTDEVILLVPLNLIMTSAVAQNSIIGRKIQESKYELRSKHSYLASYLLWEKYLGSQSYWYPYIRILPEHYNNMPIFFDEKLLLLLKGSFTLNKIRDRIESLRMEYQSIKKYVPEFGRFSYDEFVWARLVVITRIFGLIIHGQKTDGLVPYADMLNHFSPSSCAASANNHTSYTDTRWSFNDEMNGFTITSTRGINRGEEICDSYGRKCLHPDTKVKLYTHEDICVGDLKYGDELLGLDGLAKKVINNPQTYNIDLKFEKSMFFINPYQNGFGGYFANGNHQMVFKVCNTSSLNGHLVKCTPHTCHRNTKTSSCNCVCIQSTKQFTDSNPNTHLKDGDIIDTISVSDYLQHCCSEAIKCLFLYRIQTSKSLTHNFDKPLKESDISDFEIRTIESITFEEDLTPILVNKEGIMQRSNNQNMKKTDLEQYKQSAISNSKPRKHSLATTVCSPSKKSTSSNYYEENEWISSDVDDFMSCDSVLETKSEKFSSNSVQNSTSILQAQCNQRGQVYYNKYTAVQVEDELMIKSDYQVLHNCNSRFFVNYGFTVMDNEDDNECVMTFGALKNDPIFSLKMRLSGCLESNLTCREFQVPASYQENRAGGDRERKCQEMFSWLRFICSENSELLALDGNNNQKSNNQNNNNADGRERESKINILDIDPISIRNEIAVLKLIQQSANKSLLQFDTTLEQDNEQLNQNEQDTNIRNCLVMRRGEKQVLHWYLDLCSTCIPLYEQNWTQVKKQTQKCYKSNETKDFYIVNVLVPLVKKS